MPVPPGQGGAGKNPTPNTTLRQSGLGKGQRAQERTSLFRTLKVVLLPGRTFFDLDRPTAGLICYVLQASLVGWVPAALWAAFAQGQVTKKARLLAARLR